MTSLRLLIAIFFCTLLSVRAEDTYEVRLHRPAKAGDRFRIAAKIAIESETTTTFDKEDADVEKVNAACKLTGELTVVDVTRKGIVSELKLKIAEVECMNEGVKADFFKSGDVIHLRHEDDDKIVEVNGDEPDELQGVVIDDLLSVAGESEPNDDEVYGTKEKVAIGAEWPMNSALAAKSWNDEGFAGMKPGDIKGTTKLVETTTLDGQTALRFRGEMKINCSGVKMPRDSDEIKTKRFTMEASDDTEIPVDPKGTACLVKLHVKIESESSGKIEREGETVKVKIKTRHRYAYEIAETPVK
jgi:hypothetical protein